jgi:hypothetical protein
MSNTIKRTVELSPTQEKLLTSAKSLTGNQGILVSGHQYRTAISLERKGLGTVRYQGLSLGWLVAADK